MKLSRSVSAFLASCLVVLVMTTTSTLAIEASDDNRYVPRITNPILTLQVLEELAALLRSELTGEIESKRGFDGGYGSRYVAAHSVGSKLMALKQAADWNGPGRKRGHPTAW